MATVNSVSSEPDVTFDDIRRQWLDDSPWLEARSSGSTGTPKVIRLSKQLVRTSALATNSFFGITANSLLYSCVSPRFIGGKMMIIRAIEARAHFNYETPSNTPVGLLNINLPVDLLAVVPSQMYWIIENISRLPRLNNIIVGGSAIPVPLREAIAASQLNVFETYGMTETASHIALRPVSQLNVPFTPLPGVRLSLDSRGCLCVERESFDAVQTNDLAKLNTDGTFEIIGRFDNVIVTGARKVIPDEIEARLSDCIDGDFAVSWVTDDKWGALVTLCVTDKVWFEPHRRQELEENIYRLFKPHQRPRLLIGLDAIPTTPMGKLDRPVLHKICQKIALDYRHSDTEKATDDNHTNFIMQLFG
ncbi:MAG: AMP-binding protein [Muribaculaceae bacterium]|nr:AMP-binding protein [Muribaculaceae bacterium]